MKNNAAFRFQTQESLVSGFVNALVQAGMQNATGSSKTKYRFFRGYVPPKHSKEAIFLRYSVDENDTPHYADNVDFMRSIEIGGEIYTRNGYGDETFKTLCNNIESECSDGGYRIEWEGEDTDASLDADSPIALKRFTVIKNKA